MMKLSFKQYKEKIPNEYNYTVVPLRSSNMSEEVKRLKLKKGQWCFALVHCVETDQIVVAEVYADGWWSPVDNDLFDRKAFDIRKKEEKHSHTFKSYQKTCFAEAVYHTIVKK